MRGGSATPNTRNLFANGWGHRADHLPYGHHVTAYLPHQGTPANRRLDYTAARLSRALDRAAENTALAHGITLRQLTAMEVLGEGARLSNAEVARRTFVSPQAAHVACEQLITKGLAEKAMGTESARATDLALTELGWDLLEKCTAEMVELENELARRLGTRAESFIGRMSEAARHLAGGYFGDAAMEAAAVHRRQI